MFEVGGTKLRSLFQLPLTPLLKLLLSVLWLGGDAALQVFLGGNTSEG